MDETKPQGHRVRIAMKGWAGDHAATTADEIRSGLMCPWVEIDGHRFENITGVRVEIDREGFTIPDVTVHCLGAPEFVYLDRDGNELVSEHPSPETVEEMYLGTDGEIDYQTDHLRVTPGGMEYALPPKGHIIVDPAGPAAP